MHMFNDCLDPKIVLPHRCQILSFMNKTPLIQFLANNIDLNFDVSWERVNRNLRELCVDLNIITLPLLDVCRIEMVTIRIKRSQLELVTVLRYKSPPHRYIPQKQQI